MDPRSLSLRPAVPEPTIVVGLGRFGLSVLERLGETWERLREATDDPRLGNLRLLHVRGNDDKGDDWRADEASARRLADAIGEGDQPMRALDFLFLRSLGLIRYHRGMYEVALARDYEMCRDGRTRLRTFVWRELDPDPTRAIDLLALRTAREADLDLFLTPFLERVRAGHLPRVIKDAVIRASRYAEGKDPAPWLAGLEGQPVDPGGRELEASRPSDWEERVLDAGPRAPRSVLDEALVRTRRLVLGGEISTGHLGTPAERERLYLDDEALFDDDLGDAHGQLFGDAGPVSAMVRHGIANTAAARGSLVRTNELERAVVGVGGGSASIAGDGEYWRRVRVGLDAERRIASRRLKALSLTYIDEYRRQLAEKDRRRQSAEKEARERRGRPDARGMEADQAEESPKGGWLTGPIKAHEESVEDLVASCRGLWAKYVALLSAQMALLLQAHPDLRATRRSMAELLRYLGGLYLSRERIQLPALQPMATKEIAPEQDVLPCTAENAFLRALAELTEVEKALDANNSPKGDPERLATLHSVSDVVRERHLRVDDDDGAVELKQILEADLSKLDEPTRQLARARQLLAHHRLARLLDDQGKLDEAASHLMAVWRLSDDELRPEHRRTAAAHAVAAAHALGRIWQTQRRYAAAQCALEYVVDRVLEPAPVGTGDGDAASNREKSGSLDSGSGQPTGRQFELEFRVSSANVSRKASAFDPAERAVLTLSQALAADERRTFDLPPSGRLAPLGLSVGTAGSRRVGLGDARKLTVESHGSDRGVGAEAVTEGARQLEVEVELDPEGEALIRVGAYTKVTAVFTEGAAGAEGAPRAAVLERLELRGRSKAVARSVRPEHQRALDSHRLLAEHELASVLMAQEQYDAAIAGLTKELDRRREDLGWEHPDTLAIALDVAAARAERVGPDNGSIKIEHILSAVRAGHAPGSIFDPTEESLDFFDPREILGIPWETSGWTTRAVRANDVYQVAEMPLWLHGFYDSLHDERNVQVGLEDKLAPKLRVLGQVCRQGLLELFWELRIRDRPEVMEEQSADDDALATYAATLESTNLIAEMLFRPLNNAAKDAPSTSVRSVVEAFSLPMRSTARLAERRPPTSDAQAALLGQFDARLAELGALPPQARRGTDYLFSEVEVARMKSRSDRNDYDLSVFEIRRVVRELVTHMVDFDYLAQTTERSISKAPRLAVYVVADLGEPFSRVFTGKALQLLHAELLRTFTAIFKEFRGGFDRNLVIVPILWLPNPGGVAPERATKATDFTVAVRHEEAVIGDTLLGLRRAIQRMPNRARFIPNTYICSRVNDAGVIDLRESVLQTHDFLSFSTRSRVGSDEWLRALSIGPFGKDFFGTFGCVELEVPVERIREYLAGRLARVTLGELLHAEPPRGAVGGGEIEESVADLRAREDEKRLTTTAAELEAELRRACGALAQSAVGGLEQVPAEPEPDDVLARYSEGSAAGVAGVIVRGWPPMVAKGGAMDRQIGTLRELATIAVESAVACVRERGDSEVAATRRGVPIVWAIDRMSAHAVQEREALDTVGEALGHAQADALAEERPDPPKALPPIFSEVRDYAERVPRPEPMTVGVGVLALTGMVGLGVLGHAANLAAGFERAPQPLEYLLGPLVPLLGGVVGGALCFVALRAYRRRSLRRLAEVMRGVPARIRALVTGETGSVWSFLRARERFAVTHIEFAVVAMRELQTRVDLSLVRRVRLAAELAERELRMRAESLGVESTPALGVEAPFEETLTGLVEAPGGERPALIDAADVLGIYLDRVGLGVTQRTLIPDVVTAGGHLETWRERAPFGEMPALLSVGHRKFADLLEEDSCNDPRFAASVRRHLADASASLAPGLGLPGYVQGSEGLDDDGIVQRAQAEIIASEAMLRAAVPQDGSSQVRTRSATVRSHAAYLLTLVQGMAPHLPLLHRRFMGYHDREVGPTFTTVLKGGTAPVHMLTGQEERFDIYYKRFSTDIANKKTDTVAPAAALATAPGAASSKPSGNNS